MYEGHGYDSLKRQTLRAAYLDTGTFRDRSAVVQDDIRHRRQPWKCPFCHQHLTDQDTARHIQCSECRAQGWFIDSHPSDVPP